jgi:hypothetical protein
VPELVVAGVVAGDVVVAGVVVTGVVVSDADELEAAPVDGLVMAGPADEDDDDGGESLVPAVVVDGATVVDVELVEVVVVTLAASNGSRLRLVGVVGRREDAWPLWLADDDVVDDDVVGVPLGTGGAAISALARWPCSRNGTATIAATITTASGQSRRSKRSRLRDFILWPPWFRRPSIRPSVDRCSR